MTKEQKTRIEELRQKGYGYSEIAKQLSLTKSQVSGFCRRNDLAGPLAFASERNRSTGQYCPNCGKIVIQKEKQKPLRFCSTKCRVHFWNTHPEMVNKKAIYNFTCACCGKEFSAYGNAHRKYCSHGCYIKYRFQSPGGDADER